MNVHTYVSARLDMGQVTIAMTLTMSTHHYYTGVVSGQAKMVPELVGQTSSILIEPM